MGCIDLRMMLEALRGGASGRKFRLFAVACCRQQGEFMAARLRRDVAAAAEGYADDESTVAALRAAGVALRHALHISNPIATRLTHPDGALCARSFVADWREWYSVRSMAPMASLLRDIAGDPFRPLPRVDPAWLAWEGGVVARLAGTAYDERGLPAGILDGARLAVLADSLEEAGCTDANVLGHLRGPGPHVRGCRAVDLCPGKS